MVVSQQVELRRSRVAVVGGGRMGAAIAHIFASSGHPVRLFELADRIDQARSRLVAVDQARRLGGDVIDRIDLVSDIEHAAVDAEIVIEAVAEDLPLKQDIFRQLDQLAPSAILATNTSVIPIRDIAAHVQRRERVIGTHFWNPPYAVRLVEVVQSQATSPETVERTMALLAGVGQQPVHLKRDVPGFVGNRLQHALKREAIAIVEAGICDAEEVDFIVRNSFGARLGLMGPLEQSDLVGLNLTLAIHKIVLPDLDITSEPQQLLIDLVAQGKTGAAAGQGFRSWTPEQRNELENRLNKLIDGGATS